MTNEVIAPLIQPSVTLGGLSRWTLWITKGSLAILDQGLIAGSNFLIGILLARWLLPEQYGSYAVAFAVFLLFAAFHQALLLEPQRIFGPSEHLNHLREYLGVLLCAHGVLALAIAVLLAASAWLIHLATGSNSLPGALAGMAVAAPCVLLMWLARGAFYVKLAPQYAVCGGIIYCAVVFSGMFLIYRLNMASPFSAFLVMAFGALASSAVLLYLLSPVLNVRVGPPSWKEVAHQHWHYGRWVLASLVLNAVAGDIYYPLLSTFSGIAAAGELKALLNFYMLVAQTFSALAVFLLPYACRVRQQNGLPALKKLTWRIGALFGALALAYWIVLILLSKPLLKLFYGNRYIGLSSLVVWVAAASLPWNLAVVPTITLRAVRSSASIFVIYCASSTVAVLVGVPTTWIAGLRGALWAMILSNTAALAVAIFLVRKKLRAASEMEL
ncbi:MAG: oligosaccharide flippase family protein [Bryobacteraceae bacterium]